MNFRHAKITDSQTNSDARSPNSRLHEQATGLLLAKGSSKMIQEARGRENGSEGLHPVAFGGMSLTEAAHAAENSNVLKEMNASRDQVGQMLDTNHSTQLFDQMAKQDKNAAIEFAVRNSDMQTHALYHEDIALREDVRL